MAPNLRAPSDAPARASEPVTPELERIAAAATHKITGENFPVALRVLPAEVREQLRRVYTFARFVDDVGDRAAGDRLALLDAIERDVQRLSNGRPVLGPVRDLAPLVAEHAVPLQPLCDLIEANRRDQTVARYPTFADLLDYCRLSAAPVGRIVLALAGVCDPEAVAGSDRVCAALQVLEHCQDVAEDAAMGRTYLPVADLRAFGVPDADLHTAPTSAGLRAVVALETARAEQLLDAGPELVGRLSGWARVAVVGYLAGGRATVHALRRADYDVVGSAVRPSKAATGGHALRLVFSGWNR